LYSSDESLRWWAARGLTSLGTREARRALWEAQTYTFPNDAETQSFRKMLGEFIKP
jgi:hypothetical protein